MSSIVVRAKNNQIFSSYIHIFSSSIAILSSDRQERELEFWAMIFDTLETLKRKSACKKKGRRVGVPSFKTWFYAWFEINVEQMWEWEKKELCFLSWWATKWHRRRYISPPHKVVMSWKMMLLPCQESSVTKDFLRLCRCAWSTRQANGD